jgi:NADH-quinone oxidoreductase subunit I
MKKLTFNGLGLLRGLAITFRHFVDTYLENLKWRGKRYYTPEGIESRRTSKTRGVFTIQYPEEKLPIPEEFRFLPFLVYDLLEDGTKKLRCTACGICAKVCPPQCIWIVRENDPNTGRPLPIPSQFYIDVDICMNCGFCAEFCPFDSIKMDHDFEIASYGRLDQHIYDIHKLSKPLAYYAQIRPTNNAAEEAERAAKAAKKAAPQAG